MPAPWRASAPSTAAPGSAVPVVETCHQAVELVSSSGATAGARAAAGGPRRRCSAASAIPRPSASTLRGPGRAPGCLPHLSRPSCVHPGRRRGLASLGCRTGAPWLAGGDHPEGPREAAFDRPGGRAAVGAADSSARAARSGRTATAILDGSGQLRNHWKRGACRAMKPFDLHGLKTYDLQSRPSKVFVDDLGRPLSPPARRRRLAGQSAAAAGRQRSAPGARSPVPGPRRGPDRRRRPGRPRHQDRLCALPDRLDRAGRHQGGGA